MTISRRRTHLAVPNIVRSIFLPVLPRGHYSAPGGAGLLRKRVFTGVCIPWNNLVVAELCCIWFWSEPPQYSSSAVLRGIHLGCNGTDLPKYLRQLNLPRLFKPNYACMCASKPRSVTGNLPRQTTTSMRCMILMFLPLNEYVDAMHDVLVSFSRFGGAERKKSILIPIAAFYWVLHFKTDVVLALFQIRVSGSPSSHKE